MSLRDSSQQLLRIERPSLAQAREQIVEICRRTYERGWLAATDGNASVLLDDGGIVATPSGVHKGFLTAHDLVVVDRQGNVVCGDRAASSELAMHLCVYRMRQDVRAVLHAHPTNCVALSLANVSIDPWLLPEVLLSVGAIPTAPYATPTTREVPEAIESWIANHSALILCRHGSLTVGNSLFEAFCLLERMEHVAEITWRAMCLGPTTSLSESQVALLQSIAERLGIRKGLP